MMPNDRRQQLMLMAIAVTVAIAVGLFSLVQFDESLAAKEKQLTQIRQKVAVQDRKLSLGRKAATKLRRWRSRSLPSDVEAARSLYLNWLRDVVQSSGLVDSDVKSTNRITGRSNLKASAQTLSYTLNARGDMGQLTQFLYSFYERDHLHRIISMSVTPDEKAIGFQLRFTIEALVLPGADRDDRLSDAASERLAHDDVERYRKVIVERNLFGPFNHPPRMSPMGDRIAYQNTRFSLTAGASDEDEGQKVSYSLGEGAPDGARISSSGSLSWMPDESTDMGMHEIEVIARDNGLPAKEVSAVVRVEVKAPLPVPKRDDRPRYPTFEEGRLTYVVGVTESRGRRQVWLNIRTKNETLILEAGDQFSVGKLDARVAGIYNTHFEVVAYGTRYRVPYEAFLSEARPLPGQNTAAGE